MQACRLSQHISLHKPGHKNWTYVQLGFQSHIFFLLSELDSKCPEIQRPHLVNLLQNSARILIDNPFFK